MGEWRHRCRIFTLCTILTFACLMIMRVGISIFRHVYQYVYPSPPLLLLK